VTWGAAIHPHLHGLGLSATLAVQERSDTLAREGRRIYRLGLGQSPFPVPESVVAALRQNAEKKDYLPVRGLPALREAVADYLARRLGAPFSPDQILIAPGSKELMFLLQVAFDGELFIPTPAWVSYGPQAHIMGKRPRFLPTRAEDGWRLAPEALDELCRREPDGPRLLILNYPSNPTGTTYPAEHLAALAEVARRHRMIVLSDEIYAELHFGAAHVSIAHYYPEATIVSTGLSKWCGAGGWRLGVFAIPPALVKLRDTMAAIASETYTTTSAPIQYAAVSAFRGGMELERYLGRARRILGALTRACEAQLAGAGARVEPAAGGFYLFPDFAAQADALATRSIDDGAALCGHLLDEAGVACLPGSAFGRPAGELTVRLSLVNFDGARALAAAEQAGEAAIDGQFLAAHCPDVLVAVGRVAALVRGEPLPERVDELPPRPQALASASSQARLHNVTLLSPDSRSDRS